METYFTPDFILLPAVAFTLASSAVYSYLRPAQLRCELEYVYKGRTYAQELTLTQTEVANMWSTKSCDAFGPYNLVVTS